MHCFSCTSYIIDSSRILLKFVIKSRLSKKNIIEQYIRKTASFRSAIWYEVRCISTLLFCIVKDFTKKNMMVLTLKTK